MQKLHLNYYELTKQTQAELKSAIFNNWLINQEHNQTFQEERDIKEQINKLFNLNNAGIDVDIYKFLNNGHKKTTDLPL